MRKIYLYKGKLWEEIHNFRYTGELQTFHLDKGKYFMLCDGACGGVGADNFKAFAGRAMGILDLKKDSTLYAAVGGDGESGPNTVSSTPGRGGWNGGGDGGKSYNNNYWPGHGGGGASDVRLSGDTSTMIPDPYAVSIPSKYTQLHGLGTTYGYFSNHGSYVDTGYQIKSNSKIVIDALVYSDAGDGRQETYGALCGLKNASSGGTYEYALWTHYNGDDICVMEWFNANTNNKEGYTITDFIYNKDITVTLDPSGVITVADDTVTNTYTVSENFQLMGADGKNAANLALFACNDTRNYSGRQRAVIHACKIYEDDTLVHHFVPCYDTGSPWNYYFYDIIDQKAVGYGYKSSSDNVIQYIQVPYPRAALSRIIVGAGAGGNTVLTGYYNRINHVEFIGSGGGEVGTYAGGDSSTRTYSTQSDGYCFFQGQTPLPRSSAANCGAEGMSGGGGGWFGGYSDTPTGQYSSCAGGGGSSYVYTEDSWTPKNYIPDENYMFTDATLEAGVADVAQIIVAKEITMLQKNDEIYAFCTGETEKLPITNRLTLDIECYGGCGGTRSRFALAANGGYARGTVSVTNNDELYVTVGGNGLGHMLGGIAYNQLLRPTLGFNGGGMGGTRGAQWQACAPGGGATDIRICPKPVKHPDVTRINYIKVLFYERRVEYKFGADGYVGTPWFQLKYLYFYHGDERIDISEIYAYADEDGLKTVTYDSAEKATTENVSKLLTGDNMFACKWENVVNVTMKTSETIGSIDKYAMFAPSDAAVRNPAAWRVYVSENGIDWSMIDNRFNIDDSLVGNEYVVTKEEFELRDKPTHHNRVLVAGGGGGQGYYNYTTSGKGGGETGGTSTEGNAHQNLGGGNQYGGAYNTSYGKFGCDGVFGHGGQGNKYNDTIGMPGGGGGWFGGSGTYYNSGSDNAKCGGGGSGYVLTVDSYKPPCYSLDANYYMKDTTLVQGGNTLSKPQTMVKMTVLESSPVVVLAGDKAGTKYFDEDENKWVLLSSTPPTLENMNEYGYPFIPNDEGLDTSYEIYAISKIDKLEGKLVVPKNLIYGVTPKKLQIHHTGETSMRVRRMSADIDYNPAETKIDISSTKVGVGPTAHLDIDVFINKKVQNTVEKLYSIYMEAGLDTNGNRYIPPKTDEPETDNKPLPRPGDDDYIKKYLLQVGARNNIPRNFEQFQFKYNDIALSEVIETCSKVYDREIYSMMRLKFGSTYINRLTKYNTITRKTTLIKDFTQSLFDSYGVGDFVKMGNKFIFVSGCTVGHYYWYVYNMDTDTLTTINTNNSNYYNDAFGKIYQLNEQEVIFKGRYGMITYNLVRNTYSLSSGLSQYARDFCVGNKYYLVTYDSTTVHFVDRSSMAVTSMSLPLNTQTVCTFSDGKFFVAQNGYLHIIDENTKTIERSIVVPWSSCRSITYQGGVVYVTVNNSSRLWVYHLADQRYDSTILPWNLTFDTNGHVMRGVMYNNSWWIAHWTMGSVSYIGMAKYNFGQKYGQYQIAFNADTVDQLEYDDRFVTKEETHLSIHDGELSYEGTELEGNQKIKVFEVSKKDYNIYKYNSFEVELVDEIIDDNEEESETQ